MLQHTSDSIRAFIADFQNGNLPSTEDTELHKNLFSRLYGKFFNLGIRFKMPKTDLKIGYYPEKEMIEVNPVKSAYPTREKFDIVLLKTDMPVKVTAQQEKKDEIYQVFWQQQLEMALFLRHCGPDQDLEKFIRQAHRDNKKFVKFREENGGEESLEVAVSLVMISPDHQANVPEDFKKAAGGFDWEEGSGVWLIGNEDQWFSPFQ